MRKTWKTPIADMQVALSQVAPSQVVLIRVLLVVVTAVIPSVPTGSGDEAEMLFLEPVECDSFRLGLWVFHGAMYLL